MMIIVDVHSDLPVHVVRKRELVRRGYTNEDISKVMGENFLRVFRSRG